MTDELVAFLRARLDEDWEVAHREGTDRRGVPISAEAWEHVAGEADSMLVSIFSPARVLAEVEVKRQIIDKIVPSLDAAITEVVVEFGYDWPQPGSEALLRLLALPYAGNEQFQEEWKP